MPFDSTMICVLVGARKDTEQYQDGQLGDLSKVGLLDDNSENYIPREKHK